MAYRYFDDRNQTIMFPESLDQYVLEDLPVGAYDVFFDTQDFRLLGIDIDDRKVGNSQSILHGLAGGLALEST